MKGGNDRAVRITSGTVAIEGLLEIPRQARAMVLFAHGSGSGRHSPRNNFVAAALRRQRLATLLIDLLSPAEEQPHDRRFDIALLVERLYDTARWLAAQPATRSMPLGLFGASTGAAAALQLAAAVPSKVAAVVSRGGRPDLAGAISLTRLKTPTLLVVGGADTEVLALNEEAYAQMRCEKSLLVVPGATHLFEEPGALDIAAGHAADWFNLHLAPELAHVG